jgi:hypothetical protein
VPTKPAKKRPAAKSKPATNAGSVEDTVDDPGNPLAAVVEGAEEVTPQAPSFDGVIIVIARNEKGEISNMQFAPNGDVRPTEIASILTLAEAVHARQLKQ